MIRSDLVAATPHFTAVRARVGTGMHLTTLQIGAQQTVLTAGAGELPDVTLRLALGAARIAQDCFGHDPPSALELERAIDKVEDELARARVLPAGPTMLATSDGTVHALARSAGVGGRSLAREAVEALFQRMASAALGDPGAMQGLPAGRDAAATLLILREVMHHLGHASIELVDGDAAA